jgi:transposase, IS5 family
MKMPLFTSLTTKTEKGDWSRNPEFALIDTILEEHPELLEYVRADITQGQKASNFGRGDMPSVEQILRAALYKEMKGLTYRELEYQQTDSRICARFLKLGDRNPYCFQMFQSYISKIKAGNLEKLMVALSKIAISEGLESIEKFRQDSFVVETNIHYPTNNSLVWDCIKESHRLLEGLSKECADFEYRDYLRGAKKTYFRINNAKSKDKRVELFRKQLILFTKTINNVSNAVKKKGACDNACGYRHHHRNGESHAVDGKGLSYDAA